MRRNGERGRKGREGERKERREGERKERRRALDKVSHLTAFCACMRYQSPSLGHPSSADEAWYWPKCVLPWGDFA